MIGLASAIHAPFKPEYAGKLNFYLSAVDGILRMKRDACVINKIVVSNK
jgi:hypothetical protein